MTQHSHRIKTNIKFKQNENGAFYGFVTKDSNGSWRGCREDVIKKKIVFVNKHEEAGIIPNALYQCILVPMTEKNGFIAFQPQLVKFDAQIKTEATDKVYRVSVKFGNTVITYNPQSSNPNKNNIQSIVNLLKSRNDLKYQDAVADEFCDCACLLLSIYKRQND